MERILVYQSPEYQTLLNRYDWVKKRLQGLVDGMKALSIPATDEALKRLLNGESLQDEVAQRSVATAFEELPEPIKHTLQELFKRERATDYKEALGDKAAQMVDYVRRNRNDGTVKFHYFHVDNGQVVIAPEYIADVEKMYCVFADTEARLKVYKKWLQFKQAKEAFDDEVKNAPKFDPEAKWDYDRKLNPDRLMSVATPSQFSLSKVFYNGTLELNGEFFRYIQ